MSAYKHIRRTVCLVLVALLVVPAPPLRADEITTLTAVADATLQQGSSATNDGTSAVLRVLGVSAEAIRALVRFDLSPIDSTAAVKVANLKMKVAQAPTIAHTMAVHRVTGTTQWTEGGATWNSRDGTVPNNWATPGGDFSATAISTQSSGTTNGATLSWPVLTDGVVSNIVQDWLTTPANNVGLLVKDTSESASAHAAVKTVYTGTMVSTGAAPPATLSANLGTCSGASPTVNINKAFLIFQGANNTLRPNATEIRGRIVPHACPTTPPTVQFFRVTNETSTVNLTWYVVEFATGVSVQRGTVASQSSATIDVGITPVSSLSRAFVLWSKTPAAADASYSQDDPTIGDLTAVNNLQFRVTTSNVSHAIDWEVVEFTNSADLDVQRGTSTAMTAFTLSVTLAITPVDPAKSFVLVGYRIPGASSDIGRWLLRGRLSNCTTTCNQLIVDRSVAGSGSPISEIAYQVVSLNNGSSVQSASTNLASFVLTASPALSPSVDTTRSVAFTSTFSGGGLNFGRSPLASPLVQSLGVSAFTTSLAASALTLTRNNGNDQADVSWYVTELNNVEPNGVNYNAREDGTPANRPQLDVSLLRNVSLGVNSAGVSDVTLNFTYPCASSATCSYQGALIARKNGASAPTFSPVDSTVYSVGTQPVLGETVVSNANSFVNPPTVVSVVDENGPDFVVTPGTQYSYKIYTFDNVTITNAANPAAPHYSLGASATLTTSVGGGASKNWSYKTAGTALAPPGLDPGNKVIAASNDFNVHSMLATSGARLYQPTGSTSGPVQSRPALISQGETQLADCDPVTLGNQPCDVAYVGSNDGSVYAFNATTGQQIWATPPPGGGGSLVAVGGIIQGGVAVQLKSFANGGFTPTTDLVFVGTRELSPLLNKVYALDGSTGAIVWTFSPGNMDAVNSTPAVDYANNVVWVTSLSNGNAQPSLWKINSVNGAPISNFSLGDISGSPTLNFDNKVVYAVKDNGDLVAVRNDIGACANTFPTGATSGTGFPIPVVAAAMDDRIFYTTTTAGAGTVRKVQFAYTGTCGVGETFAADGVYANPSGIGTLSTPIINSLATTSATQFLYVGSSDGNLYKIDPVAGTVLASRTVNTGFTIGDPSLDVDLVKLYVGDTQGRIYSFDVF